MPPEWGEPIQGQRNTAHDFNGDPVLVAEYQRTDEVDVEDRFAAVPGMLRAQTIHRFLDDGQEVDVWGSADLDGKLRMVAPGSLVRIVYLGMEDLEGGKKIKRFTVQVDTSGDPAPSAQPMPPATGADNDDIPF